MSMCFLSSFGNFFSFRFLFFLVIGSHLLSPCPADDACDAAMEAADNATLSIAEFCGKDEQTGECTESCAATLVAPLWEACSGKTFRTGVAGGNETAFRADHLTIFGPVVRLDADACGMLVFNYALNNPSKFSCADWLSLYQDVALTGECRFRFGCDQVCKDVFDKTYEVCSSNDTTVVFDVTDFDIIEERTATSIQEEAITRLSDDCVTYVENKCFTGDAACGASSSAKSLHLSSFIASSLVFSAVASLYGAKMVL